MKHSLTRLLPLIIIFISAALIAGVVAFAQGSRGQFTQGEPTCTPNSTTHCATLGCTNITYFGNTACNPRESSTVGSACDSDVPAGCTLIHSAICAADKKSASVAYSCQENG